MRDLTHRQTVRSDLHRCKINGPVELRHKRLQLVDTHLVIVTHGVAQLDVVIRSLRQTRLHAQNRLCTLRGILKTEEAEQLLHIGYIRVTDGRCSFVGIEVILFLAQRKTRLALVEDVHRAVHRVGIDIHRPKAVIHRFTEHLRQFVATTDRLYLC